MKIRNCVAALGLAVFTAMSAQTAAAQGFTPEHTDIGPTIGLGGIGSASISIGGRFEKGIKTLPSMGDGVLGIQIGVDYYSWSNSFFSYSYIPIGATANYHFQLDDDKIDPFVGLGLGYEVISCDYKGFGNDLCSASAIYFIGKAGIRYFIQEKMSLYADVGAGASTLNVGLMFKLK